ncbi:ribbon-helix-helix protein, CopG family [Bradyrhizobium centrolobii]|uniref:ribbon-helix-helix protein, CopG family n=1 Tax=Bradyrhizobium centrolobii TaxID=1505087 RepID=UPI000A5A9AFD|nr:ribbon-helix-helix protein, CopG family [Bradyrhizobium centrolobii]
MAKAQKRMICARVDDAFAERVEAAAEKQDRGVSSFVRQALAAAMEPKQQREGAA